MNLKAKTKTFTARCPGRISLSKHADYINSDLMYLLDDREITVKAEIITDPKHSSFKKLSLKNNDNNYPAASFSYEELEGIAKENWFFYIAKILESLKIKEELKSYGLELEFSSNLPSGNGLSSSHALILSSICVLSYCFDLQDYIKIFESENRAELSESVFALIKLCQEIENSRGFNSGLGDQSAQLLGKKSKFVFIKLLPSLKIGYQDLPAELAVITAPSFIKADKSLPEFKAANENIKAYKEINFLVKELGANYLADLIYTKSEAEIFAFLESIKDKKIQGLALYGLAEAARVAKLKKSLDLKSIGKHLNSSHQAEINFKKEDGQWLARTDEEKYSFLLDPSTELSQHSGAYLASTQINDELQDFANKLDGVYGSSISGAGLGGSNIIITDKNYAVQLKERLINEFYTKHGLEEKAINHVHISSSGSPVSLIGKDF